MLAIFQLEKNLKNGKIIDTILRLTLSTALETIHHKNLLINDTISHNLESKRIQIKSFTKMFEDMAEGVKILVSMESKSF